MVGFDFKDKVVLVTGGSSGIGKATALAFAEANAIVVVASKNEKRGIEIETKLKEINAFSSWIRTDILVSTDISNLFNIISEKYKKLDIAFNNASVGGEAGKLENISLEDWNKTINGCLTSIFLCMKHELLIMKNQNSGIIVNNSSVDGLRAFAWDPAYSSAKHGVLGLTKSTALQYATENIRINAICPGWIKTPPIENLLENNPEIEKELLMHQPIGRFGTAEEVAEVVMWLSSDKSSFLLGSAITVDGGYTIV